MNTVSLYGNLTADPKLTFTPAQTAICKCDIAVNRKYKGQDEVSFFSLVAFAKTAELMNQYWSKGRPILVTGRLQQDRWQSQDGQNRSKVVIIVNELTFTGKPESDSPRQDEQPAPPMGGNQAQPVDDSIPPPIAPQPAPAQADPATPWDPNVAYEQAQEQGDTSIPF